MLKSLGRLIKPVWIAVAFTFQICNIGNCQALLQIETPKRPTVSIQGEGDTGFKLAPELRATVIAGGSFVGISSKGDSIVSVPDTIALPNPTFSTRAVESRFLRGTGE
jgi:hypothetical protein